MLVRFQKPLVFICKRACVTLRLLRWCVPCLLPRQVIQYRTLTPSIASSGFLSARTNLSPFTYDFRGGVDGSMEYFFVTLPCGGASHQEMQTASYERLTVVWEWTRLSLINGHSLFCSWLKEGAKRANEEIDSRVFSHLKACLRKTWIPSVSEAYKLVLNRNHRLLTLRAVAMVFNKLEWLAFPSKLIVTTITRC